MPLPIQPRNKVSFTKTEFLSLVPGTHYIRFLEPLENAYVYSIHWIQSKRASVLCLGDDCPICKANRQLRAENPNKKWNEIPGLVSSQERYNINVLDRTSVKICPNAECQTVMHKDFKTSRFPQNCPACNQLMVAVKESPLDKVRVFSMSRTLGEQVNDQESGQIDEETNPIPATKYDFEISVAQAGGKKVTLAKAMPERNDPVEVPEELLYDLEKSVMRLEADEIVALLGGVSLSDIFAKRKATKEVEEENVSADVDEDQVDISSEVDSLLEEDED